MNSRRQNQHHSQYQGGPTGSGGGTVPVPSSSSGNNGRVPANPSFISATNGGIFGTSREQGNSSAASANIHRRGSNAGSIGSNSGSPNKSRFDNFQHVKSYLNWYYEIQDPILREEFRSFLMTQKVGASRVTLIGTLVVILLLPTLITIFCMDLKSGSKTPFFLLRTILASVNILAAIFAGITGWILYEKRKRQCGHLTSNESSRGNIQNDLFRSSLVSGHEVMNSLIIAMPVVSSALQSLLVRIFRCCFLLDRQEYDDLINPVVVDLSTGLLVAPLGDQQRWSLFGLCFERPPVTFAMLSVSANGSYSGHGGNTARMKRTNTGISSSYHTATVVSSSRTASKIPSLSSSAKLNGGDSNQSDVSTFGFGKLPSKDLAIVERVQKSYTKFYYILNFIYIYCVQYLLVSLFLRRIYGLNCQMEHNFLTDFFTYGRCYPADVVEWVVQPAGMFMLVHIVFSFIMIPEMPVGVVWSLMLFSVLFYTPAFTFPHITATLPSTIMWLLLNLYAVADTQFNNVTIFLSNKRLTEALTTTERMEDVSRNNTMKHMLGLVASDMKEPLSTFMSSIASITQYLRNFESPHRNLINSNEDLSIMMDNVKQSIVACQSANALMSMRINHCTDFMKASKGLQLVPTPDTVHLADTLKHVTQVINSVSEDTAIECVTLPISSHIGSYIITDKQWLVENLLCLLKNGVKSIRKYRDQFGDGGHVRDEFGTNRSRLTIKVNLVEKSRDPNNAGIQRRDDSANIAAKESFQKRGNSAESNAQGEGPAHNDINLYVKGSNSPSQSPGKSMTRVHPVSSEQDMEDSTTIPDVEAGGGEVSNSEGEGDGKQSESGNLRSPPALSNNYAPVLPFSTISSSSSASSSVPSYAHTILSQLYLKFEIEDSGIGMAEDAMRSVFRHSKQMQRISEGRGLALYCLTKRLDALGGSYGVYGRSNNRRGCIFWFVIPYRRDDTVTDLLNDVLRDYDDDSAVANNDGLPPRGRNSCFERKNGIYGTNAMREITNEKPISPILDVDSKLSRQRGDSSGLSEDETTAAGASIGTRSLSQSSNQSQNTNERASTATRSSFTVKQNVTQDGPAKKNVLIVDDSVTILETTSLVIRRLGCYSISTADNGINALKLIQQKLQSSNGPTFYDVIVMDIQMPGMDGFETIRRIRQFYRDAEFGRVDGKSKTLIIAMSAYRDDETIQAALDAGADSFMPKPFDIQIFQNVATRIW